MRLKRVLGFALCLVMVVTVFSSLSSAQIPRPLRWLGQGFSDGYNRCNPGPNSDYYNPYSAHNTLLISQSPNSAQPNRTFQSGSTQPGVPFSVYASPTPVDETKLFNALPGQPVDNTFVPYDPNGTGADAIEGKIETKPEDNSAFVPRLPSQVEAEAKNAPSESVFSNSGFQVQPKVNEENLFDPFRSN